ncbi:MAG: DNA adenine methylase, partial [Methanomassiliicoccales archaeon]
MSDALLALFNNLDETPTKRSNYQRAPFGYVGGKWRSLPNILQHLPYRKSWIEVFGGSGIMTINRQPSKLDVFNDRYAGIVAFYRVLRDPELIMKLIARLELTVQSREEFHWCKETWEQCQDDVERAARWYYMIESSVINKMDAFARSANSALSCSVREQLKFFDIIHHRFKRVLVENLDWSMCLKDFDGPEAVFYCDPPYLDTDGGGYVHKFNRQDHIQLLNQIHDTRGFVALSGYPNDLYESYEWDNRIEWDTHTTARVQAFTDTNHPKGMEKTTGGPVLR